MQDNKVNFVVDAFWGSSGKGKLSAYLCDHYGVRASSAANYPNAGHTVVVHGQKYVFKVLPSAAALGSHMRSYVTAGSGFTPEQLQREVEMVEGSIFIHDRSVEVLPIDKRTEQDELNGISSTMQGSGAAMCRKLMRGQSRLHETGNTYCQWLGPDEFRDNLLAELRIGPILHEVSQGFALSIDHGTQYPYCTSRNCTPQSGLDYLGLPFSAVGDVYLNIRPYPIRVGNTETGYSGDFPSDSTELTWDEVGRRAGMPPEEIAKLAERERTTVTKRIRRVATMSWKTLDEAVAVTGATKLALNFAQYVDWNMAGVVGDLADPLGIGGRTCLTDPVKMLVDSLEHRYGLPVVYVGTGAAHDEVVWLGGDK